jgi:hypothetical protein
LGIPYFYKNIQNFEKSVASVAKKIISPHIKMMQEEQTHNIELLFPRAGNEWVRQELVRLQRSMIFTSAILGSIFISAGILYYFFSL